MQLPTPTLSPEAVGRLEGYAWPGNVRELRNVIERSIALLDGGELRPEHLPDAIRAGEQQAPTKLEELRQEVRAAERQAIIDALEEHGGNQTLAAKALGISRRTLVNRLDEFELPRPRKKV